MRTLSKFIAVLFITFPILAGAQTVEELQAQANALLGRIQELQQQLGTQGGSGVGAAGYDGCPLVGRVLSVGSTGDDVTRLQQFLARDPSIYPEGIISGYYGALTEAAVRRWQVAYNIVSSGTPGTTGFGQVGPRTAAAMSLQCSTGGGGTNSAVGGFIRVTPISGTAPLLVTVDATVNTVTSCSMAVYTVDYGDGTAPTQITVPAGNCQQLLQTLKHTYNSAGTYQVTLSAGAHRTSAIVTVTGTSQSSSSDSISANPTSGTTPVSVTFSGTMNGSKSCGGGVYTLVFGDGQQTQLSYPADACQAFSYNVTHQYTTGGTYSVRLYRGTQTSSSAATATVTLSSPVSTSYTITSVTPAYGGNPFAVALQVSYPSCAAYSLDWNDNTSPVTVGSQSGCSGGTSTANYSHTYAGAGSYTIKLKDGSGNVKTTASVVISN